MAGNGDGDVEVGTIVHTERWVEFRAGPTSGMDAPRVPRLLNKMMIQWIMDHPNVLIGATLPIVEHGFTVAVHLWFEE